MKTHTSQFKNTIKEFGREIDSKITYTINNEEIELGSEELNSITPHYEGAILKSVMKQLDINSNVEIPIGTILRYQFGVKVGNEYEYIDYGNYVVYSVEKQEDTYSYKITCYDKMLYAMKDYENSNITFPITIKDYLEAICEKVGLEYEGSQFANSDKVIDNELYLDNEGRSLEYTFRDVLDEIAQVSGGTICINNEDKLEVRYIHDVGELQTLTGSSLTLETDDAIKLDSFELEGKTTQETRSGKNLCNYTSGNNLTITNTLSAGTYTMSFKNSANGGFNIRENLQSGNVLFYFELSSSTTSYTKTFTLNEDAKLFLNGWGGFTINEVQIEKGSTATSYEQYGAMPSPDYPSELVSIGYENLLPSDLETTTFYGVTITKNSNGTYTLNGTATADISLAINNNFIPLSGTWRMQGCPSGGSSSTYMLSAYVGYWGGGSPNIDTGNGTNITYTGNVKVRFYIKSGTTCNNLLFKPMLTKDTQAHSYIPYGKYGIEIKTTGKNLFNLTRRGTTTTSGITFTINEDKTITVSGTYSSIVYFNLHDGKLPIQPNTTYTLSGMVSQAQRLRIRLFDSNNNEISSNAVGGNYTFTTPSNAVSYDLYIVLYALPSSVVYKPQLEKNSQPTTYEPYIGHTNLIVLDNPLRSNKDGTVKDLAYIKNGMLYVDRKIGNKVFNGNENGWYMTTDGNYKRFSIQLTNIGSYNVRKSDLLSNYFKPTTISGYGIIYYYDKYLYFYPNNDITTLEAFKTWLSTHNTEVQYVLNEPYTEELGSVDMPSTYEGITYLDAPNTTSVSYISEFEEIDEEYLKDVNVNFGEKFGAVNTIVLSRGGDGDKIALSNPTDLADEDKIAIQITDNQIMNGNNRADFMQPILSQLYGLEYYINDFSSTGICYLDLCDRYRIKIGNNSYKCIMFNDEVDITQGLEELIYTDMQEENEQEYKYIGSTDRGITQANIIANKADATISSFTRQLDATNNRLNSVEVKQTATDETINIISTNIDANGNITEVTTTTGFTFNADGMTISDSNTNFSALHRNDGTYYYDGDTITGQYTKDGSKQKDLELFGVYYYGKNDINDDPMFVAQLYTDENGEECMGHFYNRGDN